MSPRAGGVLALIAAVLLAMTFVIPWWTGAPSVDGHSQHVREVNIDLLKSEGCNVEGDKTCKHIPLGGGFKTVEVIELVSLVAAALVSVGLGIAALTDHPGRKKLAKLPYFAAGASLGGALLLLVMGPDVIAKGHDVTVPIGVSPFLAIGGAAVAIVAAALGGRDAAPRRLVVAATPLPPPVNQQSFDMQALLREDTLRPSDLGPMSRPPPSPGGTLPGPSGPLAPVNGQPLFQSAPQLRPLYEMPGTGFVPPPPPSLPLRAPTPIPLAQLQEAIDSRSDADGWSVPKPQADDARAETDWGDQQQPRPSVRVGSQSVDPLAQTSVDMGAFSIPPPPRRAPLPGPTRNQSQTRPPPLPAIPPRAPTPPPPPPPTEEDERAPTDVQDISDESRPTILPRTHDSRVGELPEDSQSPVTDEVQVVSRPPTADLPAPIVEEESGFAGDDSTSPEMQPDLDELETKGHERLSSSRMEATNPLERPSISVIASSPPPPPTDKVPVVPAPVVAAKLPVSTAPADMPPPKVLDTPAPASGPTPACPQCESPMAWVEEHLRFYCKSCKMYF